MAAARVRRRGANAAFAMGRDGLRGRRKSFAWAGERGVGPSGGTCARQAARAARAGPVGPRCILSKLCARVFTFASSHVAGDVATPGVPSGRGGAVGRRFREIALWAGWWVCGFAAALQNLVAISRGCTLSRLMRQATGRHG